MNIFRLVADMLHLASILILLLKIMTTRSAAGISFKTQALYTLVFCTRYLDLFYHFVSLYNTFMKIFFIGSSFYILYSMMYKFKTTWNPSLDAFPVKFLLIPCGVLALLIHPILTLTEVLWSFSIYLEAVAILPQLFQLSKTGEAETITTHYLAALGGYRALYLVNWVYRYFADGYLDWIAIVAGVVQTALYADFLYIYTTRVLKGKKFTLPA